MTSPHVRVVSWNCAAGLPKKAERLAALDPDVAVVCEASDEAEIADGALRRVAWSGANRDKGLAVFVRDGLVANVDPVWDESRQHFIPLHIGADDGFDLLAVWAMNHRSDEPRPKRGRTLDAIRTYRDFLEPGRTIVIGDFNNNVRWDTASRPGFQTIVDELADAGYTSVYHAQTGETQGDESVPTYYHLRDESKPYAIDHTFVPTRWLQGTRLEVGAREEWLDQSDHMPLILDLAIAPSDDEVG